MPLFGVTDSPQDPAQNAQLLALSNRLATEESNYPSQHLHVWGYGVPPTGKSFTVTLNAGAELGRFASLSSPVNGDSVEYEVSLKAGSYRMSIYGQRNTTRGISVVYFDGRYIGHYDWVNGGAVQRQLITFDFTATYTGIHVVKTTASPSSGGSSLALSTIAIHALSGLKQIPTYFRINCGSATDWTDPQGNIWTRDLFAVGGTPYDPSYSGLIANTDKQKLYQSERSLDNGSFSYTCPVTVPGVYTCRLHFSENYFDNGEFSTRPLGTVAINGSNVLTNFSIFNQAGGMYRALVKEFTNLSLSSNCVISFTNTLINAIELFKI